MSSPLTTLDARTLARFWAKVSRGEGCWLWNGADRGNGYGALKVDRIVVDSHRLSWVIHYGEIPEGQCILHRCDVRRCVRPDHLFLGTKADNARDMVSKGRKPSFTSEAHAGAKLTYCEARQIIAQFEAGARINELAAKYEVDRKVIERIIHGTAYTRPPNYERLPSTATLTAQDREQIRSRHVAGESIRSVARAYSLPVSTARSVVRS